MILLGLHVEDPDGMGDSVNKFFPELSIMASSEAALFVKRWDMDLDCSVHTPHMESSSLIQKQNFSPIIG